MQPLEGRKAVKDAGMSGRRVHEKIVQDKWGSKGREQMKPEIRMMRRGEIRCAKKYLSQD